MTLLTSLLVTVLMMNSQTQPKFRYPASERMDFLEEIHGVKVPDPYRWLEDLDSEKTKKWIRAQNELTNSFFRTIPERPKIRARLKALWNYERYGIPFKRSKKYFFTKNSGLQKQSVFYAMDSLKDKPRVLLDPNQLSKDGTIAVVSYSVSEDGKYLAYGISDGGSDWIEWRVRDVDTGKDRPDRVKWSKFSTAEWAKDSKGFYYGRYDEPKPGEELQSLNYYHKIFYHRLGTKQGQDVLVYERPDEKEWFFEPRVTEDGKYLILMIWKGTERENRLFYKDLTEPNSKVVELLDKADAAYHFVGNEGPLFWIRTDKDAPFWRLVAIDTRNPSQENWKTVIPETRDTLDSVSLVGERFIARYLKDAQSVVKVFRLDGKFETEIKLPGVGSAYGFEGRRKDQETFYGYTSFLKPMTIFHYDIVKRKSRTFRAPKISFDSGKYITKQVFYTSKDGTRVPLFITHKKNLRLTGNHPTLLYGYGGFGISLTPWFSQEVAGWLELGGVYAVACLRGGGEYGVPWHEAGKLQNKQNVFDDFISAAEWLIQYKYTNSRKLAIHGSSNGGLLVGAVLTQRPELFGAALPDVGVLDMLRFHKFTIGWAWTTEYGSPDNPDAFRWLYAYSPYHRIKPATKYPPTLITTSDHDDRVVPIHSFKFAAALQAAQGGEAPILIRIETRAGHGMGKPTDKQIDLAADMLSFLLRVFEMKLPKDYA